MKKILQIVSFYYPHIGGIEQVARNISRAFEGEDVEMKVLCFNEDARDGDVVCKRKEEAVDTVDGVEVIRCKGIARIASQPISLSFGKKLKDVMKAFNPDIVILHFPNPFAAHYLLKHSKMPFKLLLYWHLDITRQKILGKLFKGQTMRLLERADKVIATSPNYITGSPFLSACKDKCTVISCCVDDSKCCAVPDEELIKPILDRYAGKTVCFALGRHVEYKGFGCLIEAAKALPDDIVILLGGKGPLTDKLKEQAAGDPHIVFLGRISDEEVCAYLQACDIFCFPSITKNEAFGIALAEAMCCGKPAITYTIPGSGVNYVSLDGVTGIECPNSDTAAYAQAIIRLARDPGLRASYGAAAKARVGELFTQQIFTAKICALAREVSA